MPVEEAIWPLVARASRLRHAMATMPMPPVLNFKNHLNCRALRLTAGVLSYDIPEMCAISKDGRVLSTFFGPNNVKEKPQVIPRY